MSKLLWVDCLAGALAGGAVLTFLGWLSSFYELSEALLRFVGVANLVFASFSFSLAVRSERPRIAISGLVLANAAWSLLCFGLAATFAGTARVFGVVHLVAEGIFVGGLAGLEWRWREELLTARSTKGDERGR